MQQKKAMLCYARALAELGESREVCFRYQEELKQIAGIFQENEGLLRILESPRIPREEKRQLLHRLFAGSIEPHVMNLLLVMEAKGRILGLPFLAEVFEEELRERFGYVKAYVKTAHVMDEAEAKRMQETIQGFTGKEVLMETETDPALIGGMLVRIGDTIYDGSLAGQLRDLAHSVTEQRWND